MDNPQQDANSNVLAPLNDLLPDLESFYKDIHANPELSMQETRTAKRSSPGRSRRTRRRS